ncbi:MAG: tRNA 2-selenouridine(34) synthase MnmH [Firmicutes bacterium]|nr:tRNA 2-selenouridine(34) synthase MnmH [Bacillota bacterium]
MFKDIKISDALELTNITFIDLRSEKEYKEDTIPGAVNVPLFNNEERAQVGTVYKQVGVEDAKKLGMDIVGTKLSNIYMRIKEYANGKMPVMFCWRGGMRSQFVASVMSSMGLPVYRIEGGYKSYRKFVYHYLYQQEIPYQVIVLHGLTGVGKTKILEQLHSENEPVLDLEDLASHRGSVYGKINMPPSPTQKSFESYIFQKIYSFKDRDYFFVECESKRIGNVYVPPRVHEKIKNGCKILIYSSLENRVQRIIEDYTTGSDNNIEKLQKATTKLEKYLGNNKVKELNLMLDEHKYSDVFAYLLTKYYDPLYKYPQQPDNNYDYSVSSDQLEFAVKNIQNYIENRLLS